MASAVGGVTAHMRVFLNNATHFFGEAMQMVDIPSLKVVY